jgi:hypothetical protein
MSGRRCSNLQTVRERQDGQRSIMKRVSGWRSINAAPASTFPQHSMLTGKSCFTARAPINRPDTYQRLSVCTPSLANGSRSIHKGQLPANARLDQEADVR